MITFENKTFNGKTWRVEVFGHKGSVLLGYLSFWAQWRKYVFFPTPGTLYDESCLDNIAQELKAMNENRTKGNG